jgi:hypothetical protein
VSNFPSAMLWLTVTYTCIRYQLFLLLHDSFPKEDLKKYQGNALDCSGLTKTLLIPYSRVPFINDINNTMRKILETRATLM